MASAPPKARTWRVDRAKRARIIASTIDVIREHGLKGVNHRRVAAAAKVSLSATTYYFTALDELLEAALGEAMAIDLAMMEQRLTERAEGSDIVAAMAQMLADGIRDGSFNLPVEFSVAAIRNPRFRALAFNWEEAILRILGRWLDPIDARVLSALTYGLAQVGIVSTEPPDVADLEAVLRRGLQR